MRQDGDVDDLEALTTDELRDRAYELAEKRHDVRFFWDLIKHTRQAASITGEDASSGNLGGSLAEVLTLVRELRGKMPLGDDEPLLRARFLDYLRTNGAG